MVTSVEMQALDVARALAAAGVPVFVAYPDPASATGYRLPLKWQITGANPAYVDAWQPGRALCAVMGQGLDLVDVDPRNGGDVAALDGMLPAVLGEAESPSGGRHLFVASTGVGSRDGILPGIDVKAGDADGQGRGFAFIAPTVRNSKVTGQPAAYRWIRPPDLSRLGTGSPDCKLAELVRSSRNGSATALFRQPGPAHAEGWTDPDIARLIREGIPAGVPQQPALRDAVASLIGSGYDQTVCWGIWQAIVDRTTLTDPGWPWAEADFADMYDSAVRKYGTRPRKAAPDSPDDGGESGLSRLEQLRGELLDSGGLDSLHVPESLIDGWLFRDSLAWLHAKPGNYKTLLSLDWACCIDAGLPWLGHPVSQGPVLYVIAEGATGLQPRVRAWEDRARIKTGVRFLPVAVQLLNAVDVQAVADLAAEMGAVMVVIDTQARVTIGAEENSAVDMGRLVVAAERIRKASRACVLFDHHEARGGDNMRGSTALEGAADTVLRIVKDGRRAELTNPKQKDAPEHDPLTFWVVPKLQSVVIAGQPNSNDSNAISASETKILGTLLESFGATGASATTLRQATGLPESTFHWALNRLVKDGRVQNTGSRSRSCYVPAQEQLGGNSNELQRAPTPTTPSSNAHTRSVGLGVAAALESDPYGGWGEGTEGAEANR